ncbi:hypothetical protein CDD81_330 [Ophiocordyceps australis]|uniref:CPAF-like PDZ domain-containing protein n=1 Tax=Ophiocordyceps australis TaxID=1399860 RepID=A0A2C5Y1F5_9HYPO|nr:hypothetical protein CDD81_330 [Ophiocordyceps australis]
MRLVTSILLTLAPSASVAQGSRPCKGSDAGPAKDSGAENGPSTDACGTISRQLQAQFGQILANLTRKTMPENLPPVPGQPVQDCLQSFPYQPNLGKEFAVEFSKYVQFQSTLETLQDPPKTYASEPADILGGLEKMGSKEYKSQNDFDLDLVSLVASAHDGHFGVTPCTMSLFSFQRDHSGIVSVSSDGLSLPELYTFNDAAQVGKGNGTVSSITKINGQDPNDILQDIAKFSTAQDPDSRYNEVFRSSYWLAGESSSANGTFVDNGGLWPGANITTLTFSNGSTAEMPTVAILREPQFLSTASGQEAFEAFCRPPKENKPPEKGEKRPPPESSAVGFPEPFMRDPYNEVNGYFLDKETTVMYISTFGTDEEESKDYPVTYADTMKNIIAKSKESGRTKMIIDISGNGGGSANRLYNMFRIFFPDKLPNEALRFRRHPASQSLVEAFRVFNDTEASELPSVAFRAVASPGLKTKFNSPEELLGDQTLSRVKVSSAYNLDYNLISTKSNPITGFGEAAAQAQNASSPYAPEDLLIMGNGHCHSSCAEFVHFMTTNAPIRTVVFGGQPKPGPMQIIGGVRGALVMDYEQISDLTGEALEIINDPQAKEVRKEELAMDALPIPFSSLPIRLLGGSVNYESVFPSAEDEVPLQFQTKNADCRLFYTAENIFNPMTAWKAAKDAGWGGAKCVEGSKQKEEQQQKREQVLASRPRIRGSSR